MIELTRETGNGQYYTLTGMGILIELISEAINISGVGPADVFVRFQKSNTRFDVMFPTPHTILFENCSIEEDKFDFRLGAWKWNSKTGTFNEVDIGNGNLR